MFIRFFKSSFFSQYLAIALTGLGLWVMAFLKPPAMPAPFGPVPLYKLAYDLLADHRLAATMIAFFVVMAETYWLSRILSDHELVLKNSSLSALVFIVMASSIPEQLTLTPINIALGFMILIIYHLLISYNKPEHLDRIFAAGFFTAVASMFYLPFILWFVFVIISFLVFRAGNWRAWMAAFLGLITPFLYLAVYYFWNDQLLENSASFPAFFRQFTIFPQNTGSGFRVISGFTLLIAIWGIVRFRRGPQKTVEIRVKTNILLWTIVFTIISFLFSGPVAIFHAALALPALAMLITGALLNLRRTRPAEILLLCYFLVILINNLFLHDLAYL